ncbi:1-phosphofructokinase [Terribacillus saccharophilus]|uniref:Tagatose-6-phosphate kinase n=1 Tax=Terribacillus saccharophilus TaxID=361277 RepID=A0A075LPW4_9BACI|nr:MULTISPECIES: 1-phosphofructokinase [Terribacillus]AIF68146.1 phosphofructokinase [Terribacillus goriensis]MCM3226412.1 1-phosphofructokinase [Terribacillus saccharophilus]MEC0282286.1 1-phosphofructokinase [Terribacillus saccharophilus]MEC0288955.1 1-phosphofructokinase [Terribacillus saccharophilus]SEN19976.1 fructose-1-phosphate kinase [Terribacillus saccharophilus]
MNYTCTLNPSIDYIMHVDGFKAEDLNRATETAYFAGGKGINVSRLLKRLDVDTTALGYIGGFTGAFIRETLESAGIEHQFIEINEPTRVNVKLKSGGETEINGPGPSITTEQLALLFEQIRSLGKQDALVAAGNAPGSVPADIYARMADICEENGTRFIADTSSAALRDLIGKRMFLVKPNHHELGELFDTTISSIEDIVSYARKLHETGIENVIVSMGGEGAIFVNKDHAWKAQTPKGTVKNSVGAGDSMVAGFLAAYEKSGDYKQAFTYAVAAGSATAFSDDLGERQYIEELVSQVKLTSI